MMLSGPYNSGKAVQSGGAGTGTANTDYKVPVSGKVVGAYLRYNDSPPAGTTDVTIKTLGVGAPSYNLLVLTNAATDGLFLIGKTMVDATGTALTYDGSHGVVEGIPVYDGVNIKIEQANTDDSVDVWLFLK